MAKPATKPATRYVVVVDGKPGAYGIWVPDMPGCTSMGNTIADVLTNAQEALQLWAGDALESGEALPKPRSIEVIRKDRDVARDLADGAALAIPGAPARTASGSSHVKRRFLWQPTAPHHHVCVHSLALWIPSGERRQTRATRQLGQAMSALRRPHEAT